MSRRIILTLLTGLVVFALWGYLYLVFWVDPGVLGAYLDQGGGRP